MWKIIIALFKKWKKECAGGYFQKQKFKSNTMSKGCLVEHNVISCPQDHSSAPQERLDLTQMIASNQPQSECLKVGTLDSISQPLTGLQPSVHLQPHPSPLRQSYNLALSHACPPLFTHKVQINISKDSKPTKILSFWNFSFNSWTTL